MLWVSFFEKWVKQCVCLVTLSADTSLWQLPLLSTSLNKSPFFSFLFFCFWGNFILFIDLFMFFSFSFLLLWSFLFYFILFKLFIYLFLCVWGGGVRKRALCVMGFLIFLKQQCPYMETKKSPPMFKYTRGEGALWALRIQYRALEARLWFRKIAKQNKIAQHKHLAWPKLVISAHCHVMNIAQDRIPR